MTLTQEQIKNLQRLLSDAHRSITAYKSLPRLESKQEVMYNVGKAMGAYHMVGDACIEAHIHACMQDLMDRYVEVTILTTH